MKFFLSKKNFNQIILIGVMTLVFLTFNNCSQTGPSSGFNGTSSYPSPSVAQIVGSNVTPITVGCGYVNQPCVSVTICEPANPANCQTIPNLLLDTGSVGIRIFSSVVNASISSKLLPIKDTTQSPANPYMACAVYGDGSYQWGPLVSSNVVIGGMPAVNMPIQLVDFSKGDGGTACKAAHFGVASAPDVASSGYNGIVGIEFFLQDCGAGCTTSLFPYYYTCTGSGASTSCAKAIIPLASQLRNVIAAQATDNNGYYIQLPSVAASGAYNPTGYLVFGIGTQPSNNITPSNLKVLNANSSGQILTTYGSAVNMTAIIDSGSNGYYFPSSLTVCATPLSAFYCPGNTTTLSAIQLNAVGSVSATVSFTISNADHMYSPGNAFSTLGGPTPTGFSGYFDWGLPFFFGKVVCGGVENNSVTIGGSVYTGPFWAY